MEKTRQNKKLKIIVLWQSLVVKSYRSFFTNLAKQDGIEVALISPHSFRELGSQIVPCAEFSSPFDGKNPPHQAYVLKVLWMHTQIVFFLGLRRVLKKFFGKNEDAEERIFFCVAEPYSITAFYSWICGRIVLGPSMRFICSSMQNIYKEYPFPLQWILGFLLRNSTAQCVGGEEHRTVLEKHGYHGKFLKFPLWFDSEVFYPKGKKERFNPLSTKLTFGFAGSLVEEKGIWELLEAFTSLPDKIQAQASLLFVGRGKSQEELQEKIRNVKNVYYLGALNSEEMAEFFSSLDLLLIPSKTTAHWKEQFGRVIIEAMACGCTVLGSDSGEIPHLILDPMRIFPEGSSDGIGKCIQHWVEVLEDKKAETKIRHENMDYAVKNYSDKVLAGKFHAELLRLGGALP